MCSETIDAGCCLIFIGNGSGMFIADTAYERTEKAVRVVLPGIQPNDLEKVKGVLAEHSFTDYVIRQESW